MGFRSEYKTKQKEILLDYLRSVPGVHVTAGQVVKYFEEHDTPIAQSTIYRQLEKLVDEGVINKYTIDGSSPACFEYVGTELSGGSEPCIHCKCEKCGILIHLRCDEIKELQSILLIDHKFELNPTRTVLYGLCEKCR